MFNAPAKSAESEAILLHRAAAWPTHLTHDSLPAEVLREITRSEGVDFATALLFHRLQHASRHAEFIQRIDALRHRCSSVKCQAGVKVVIVPGALYRERPDMGGDGRLVREVAHDFGCTTDLIPIASCGGVSENARLIQGWLEQHRGERIILVSLSKGGADMKTALALSGEASLFGDVIAWVNVCGPLNGSAMANWVLKNRWRRWLFRAKFWCQRRDFEFITSLRHGVGAPLATTVRVLDTIQMINLIGFPLRRHLTTRFSRFCHRTLAVAGPNDGTTLLSDLGTWPGVVYPAWGMDHYFRPELEARRLVCATLQHLLGA